MSKLDEVLERTRAEEPEDEPEAGPEQPDEQETPDEDVTPAPEPPEPPAGVDEKAVDKEMTRHEKALQKLLGEGWADLSACPTCNAFGYVPLDFTPPPPMTDDPGLVVCGDCNGWGDRLTPSLKDNYRAVPCEGCNGRGYLDRSQIAALEQAKAWNQPPALAAPPPPPVWDQTRGGYVDHLGNLLTSGNPNGAPALTYAGTP